uniref:Uncharacterized protein n=1 Tax=Candidatus Nitrotoga fabula TaxID=2182327 RepID=A0A2X0QUK3_9PROT|nr:protein of unknown function [Candidatus Nitrotoga fabula]
MFLETGWNGRLNGFCYLCLIPKPACQIAGVNAFDWLDWRSNYENI